MEPSLSDDARAILTAVEALQAAAERTQNDKYDVLHKEMMALSASVKTAFPDGDMDGHRRYHELLIEEALERKQMRMAVLTHLIKSSTWSMLVGMVGLMVYGLLKKLGIL